MSAQVAATAAAAGRALGSAHEHTRGQSGDETRGHGAQDSGPADQPVDTHGQTNLPADRGTCGRESRSTNESLGQQTGARAIREAADSHLEREPAAAAAEAGQQAAGGGAADALEAALAQLGPFGLYQRYALAMLCAPSVLAAMYSLNYVFVAGAVPFRCVVPQCEGPAPLFAHQGAAALLPAEPCLRHPPLDPSVDSCERYDYHNTTAACDLFVYENMDTTFAEFELACREWQRTLVGTVRNSALPIALLLTGYISDTFGRRAALCASAACAGALGLLKACASSHGAYLALESLEAALGYGFTTAACVMIIELARPSLRAPFACATGVAYGVGGVLFAWVAWRVRYWRHLLVAIHAPALLLPLYWLLVDESVRWLHARGRSPQALAIIRKAARWNKVILDDEVMKKLASYERPPAAPGRAPAGAAWRGVAQSRALRARLALCAWCWAAVAFVYYGLTINAVALAGDKYVNFALNMAMEIVASLLIMMALERFGRRRSIFCAFLLCGLSCVIPFFVSHAGAGLAVFFVGKLSISFAFNSLYVYTAELFPTRVRGSALAACALLGRLGAVLAPQTPLLATLYGACSLSAACGVLLAPETRRAPLPADVAAAERVAPPEPPAPDDAPPPPRHAPLPADVAAAERVAPPAPHAPDDAPPPPRHAPLPADVAAAERVAPLAPHAPDDDAPPPPAPRIPSAHT